MIDNLKIPPPLEIKRWAEMIGDGYATPAARTLEGQMVVFADSLGPTPPPPIVPIPDNWIINSQKTFQQQFGSNFAMGTGGNKEVDVLTRFDLNSPSLSDNTVVSLKFQVGKAGEKTNGTIGGITGSRGGTPWFFISEGSPANLSLVVENGKFSYRAATAATSYIAWMVEGVPLPPGSFPAADKRIVLKPNTDYYFNIIFYNLKNLIDNGSYENTCTRPTGNPATWVCQARLNGTSR